MSEENTAAVSEQAESTQTASRENTEGERVSLIIHYLFTRDHVNVS